MKLPRAEPTFRVQFTNGRFAILFVLLLLSYLAVAELLVRTFIAQAILGVPSVGSTDEVLESRLDALRDFASGRDAVDCVMLGDSTVMTNFKPDTFATSFREETGKDIKCFNFGSGAFTLVDMADLAQIVVNEYSPGLLLIGIEALNFTVSAAEPGGADFSEIPWTQYKLGQFTIAGWLYEHSALYRHRDVIRQLLTLQTSPSEIRRFIMETDGAWRDGFFPLTGPGPFNVAQPPDPQSDHPYHENYFGSLTKFQLLPEHLAALDRVLALNSPATQVVIVEMPVPETFFYYFGNGEEDYNRFIDGVTQRVGGTAVPFWTTTDLQLFPDDLWFNYNHLNATGAPLFSEWLGSRLGQAALEGTVNFPAETDDKNSR